MDKLIEEFPIIHILEYLLPNDYHTLALIDSYLGFLGIWLCIMGGIFTLSLGPINSMPTYSKETLVLRKKNRKKRQVGIAVCLIGVASLIGGTPGAAVFLFIWVTKPNVRNLLGNHNFSE